MIKISKASRKSTSDWVDQEWHKVDIAHYGRPVEWNQHSFRFKATENDKLVGLISGNIESGVLQIGQIIVAKESRGKGLGTMLINKAEEFGKKYGSHMMWLITGKDWSENTFYQKLGFKLIATLPDFNFHKDFVVYTKLIK